MKQGHWAIAVVSMILGVMVVSQYRMTQVVSSDNVNLQRVSELSLQLTDIQKERDELKSQLNSLKSNETTGENSSQIEDLKNKAGLTDVVGEGVIVTINDSKVPVKSGDNPNLYLIHDEDILRVVNELRAGGAEAISINDQRLIGTSEIRCSGPTITVNGKLFGPPYVIKAVGNQNTLNSALTMRGGVGDSLKYWGIEMSIQKMQGITIPAYTGVFRQDFAKNKGKGGDL